MIKCVRCSIEIDENNSFWEEDGQICQVCMDKVEREKSFVKTYGGLAVAALTAAIISLFFNLFLIPSIVSVASAVYVFKKLRRPDDQEEEMFIKKHRSIFGCTLAGIIVAAISLSIEMAQFLITIALS